MRQYRIAFFTADWNYELVETTLRGLRRFVENHENVRLCVFDCFGKDLNNANDRSEYAIFNLPDLTQFDGLLIQGSQIVLEPVRNAINQRVAAAGIPAVSIDCPMEGVAMISLDNRIAQFDIVDHVIRAHGARRLVYLTGILDNGCPEAILRRDGFLDACKANGVTDTEVIECTWRTSDGMDVARRWMDSGRPLPDAFISANDEMALGMMEVFRDHGVNIPSDVIVTGFDDVTSAELSSPRLSTVRRDYERLMDSAMRALIGIIDGTERRKHIPFAHEIICSESCGCPNGSRQHAVRDKYFQQVRLLKNFYTFQDAMAEEMLEADDLPTLMNIVQRSRSIFGCENVYLCINDYYFDNYDKKQWDHDSETFGDTMVLTQPGNGASNAACCHRFPRKGLLPEKFIERERFLVFYPLHYNTYSLGYIAMNGISEAAKLNLHKSIFNFIEIAIENVRKKGLLRQLNGVLDDLYVRDGLTQLYNRFGLERYGQEVFDRFRNRDGSAQILFIDMDDMKGINDHFGHEVGDRAIRTTAEVLKAACREEDFVMRYGGDEFLVITSGARENLAEVILREAEERMDSGQLPFHLGLSIGKTSADLKDERTLEDCVLSADACMYEHKTRHRSG